MPDDVKLLSATMPERYYIGLDRNPLTGGFLVIGTKPDANATEYVRADLARPDPSEEDVERVAKVALAIERADREKCPEYDDLAISHPEISDWGIHLARAAINALKGERE